MSVPRVSIIMTTHDHERWVAAALQGALDQDWPDLEILVYDDASSDGTWPEIERSLAGARGARRVVRHRQAERVGPNRNFCAAVAASSGEWIVVADGDDVSEPSRVRRLVEAGGAADAGLVSSNATLIAADGATQGLFLDRAGDRDFTLQELAQHGWRKEMLGASFAFRRELIDAFEPFDPLRLPSGVDHVLPVRAAILFPGAMRYLDEPLIRHRQHPGQLTQQVADASRSKLAFQEGHAGFDVTAAMQCLTDLKLAWQRRPDDTALRRAVEGCTGRVLARVSEWTRLRNRLLDAGQRPTWTDGERMAAAPVGAVFTPKVAADPGARD